MYNPLPVRYPLAKNLVNTDQTLSVSKLYENIELFSKEVLAKKYHKYYLQILSFNIVFSAKNTHILAAGGNVRFAFYCPDWGETCAPAWDQNVALNFQTQEFIYQPDLYYILFYEIGYKGGISVDDRSEIFHPKRDIMSEAEALGGKAFRQKYCKRDCQIFVGVEDHHHEPNFENELPDKIRNEWGRPLAQVHYKSPEGPFLTVWFLYAGKTWVIDSEKAKPAR
ncbi:MAG: hypothetical protein IV090_25675 [Candidatus Sericytochromatia bacterium]|nr:hypothetical protein [Candidatus Sericytochromatia bacterium]